MEVTLAIAQNVSKPMKSESSIGLLRSLELKVFCTNDIFRQIPNYELQRLIKNGGR